jgi:hypothetical protein
MWHRLNGTADDELAYILRTFVTAETLCLFLAVAQYTMPYKNSLNILRYTDQEMAPKDFPIQVTNA